jgi:hypothetical protein
MLGGFIMVGNTITLFWVASFLFLGLALFQGRKGHHFSVLIFLWAFALATIAHKVLARHQLLQSVGQPANTTEHSAPTSNLGPPELSELGNKQPKLSL